MKFSLEIQKGKTTKQNKKFVFQIIFVEIISFFVLKIFFLLKNEKKKKKNNSEINCKNMGIFPKKNPCECFL